MTDLPTRHRHLPLHRYRGQHRAAGSGTGRRCGQRSLGSWPSCTASSPPTMGSSTRPSVMAPRRRLRPRRTRCGPPWPANARSWPRTGASSAHCRVRMALHAGEAAPDDRGDYLAAPLNRLVPPPLDWLRRPDPPLPDRPATDPRRAARWDRASGPGRAPAARSAGAGAGLPAAAPGPAGRVPAPQVAGVPSEQSALASRPRSWAGSERCGACRRCCGATTSAADPDRSRAARARRDWRCRPLLSSSRTSPMGSTLSIWPR